MGAVEVNGYTIEPGADLTGANLSDADLTGANLSEARLTGANLAGTLADKDTQWPDDFDPVAAGVIFE